MVSKSCCNRLPLVQRHLYQQHYHVPPHLRLPGNMLTNSRGTFTTYSVLFRACLLTASSVIQPAKFSTFYCSPCRWFHACHMPSHSFFPSKSPRKSAYCSYLLLSATVSSLCWCSITATFITTGSSGTVTTTIRNSSSYRHSFRKRGSIWAITIWSS